MPLVMNNVLVSLDMMENNVTFVRLITFSHHLVTNASCVCYADHVSTLVMFPNLYSLW